ncbi:MAG: cation:proton antiporter [Betaproteobacteria bacterium]|jgi:CPA1 family monovalent cation:H+ antiporter
MPTTIGVMAAALVFSLALVRLDAMALAHGVRAYEEWRGRGARPAMSDTTRRYLDMFWELVDEILNATLFVLLGMEVLLVAFSVNTLVAAAVATTVTLLARLFTVGLPMGLLRQAFNLPKGSWTVLTWGGLRGGISVALALSLPASAERNTVVALTYGVVVFSILVQGLSIGYITRKSVTSPAAS